MSDTPETEQVKAKLHTNWNDLLNHARQLERERDEAREAMREAWLAMDEIDGTDRIVEWQNKYANILEETK